MMDIGQAYHKAVILKTGVVPDFGANGANSSSLQMLNARCETAEITQDELNEAWILCQEENRIDGVENQLSNTDKNIIRVIEDLITILIQKGNINLSDFSQPAQDKLLARKALRDEIGE